MKTLVITRSRARIATRSEPSNQRACTVAFAVPCRLRLPTATQATRVNAIALSAQT